MREKSRGTSVDASDVVAALRRRLEALDAATARRLQTALVSLVARAEGDEAGRSFVVRDGAAFEAEGLGRLAESLAQRGDTGAGEAALQEALALLTRTPLEGADAVLAWSAIANARARFHDPRGCDEALALADRARVEASVNDHRARGYFVHTLATLERDTMLAEALHRAWPGLPPLDASLAAMRALTSALGRGDAPSVALLQERLAVCAGFAAEALGEGVERALANGHASLVCDAITRLPTALEAQLLAADTAVVAAALGQHDLATTLADQSRDAAAVMPHRVSDAFLATGRDAIAESMVPSAERYPSHPLSLPRLVMLVRALQRRGPESLSDYVASRTLWIESHPTATGPTHIARLHLGCALAIVGERDAGREHIEAALAPLSPKVALDRLSLTLAPPLLLQAGAKDALATVYQKTAKLRPPLAAFELAIFAAREGEWAGALAWVAKLPTTARAHEHTLSFVLAAGRGLPEPRLGVW